MTLERLPRIWIVTPTIYSAERIYPLVNRIFPEAERTDFFRTYHFESAIERGELADLLITTDTCKNRFEDQPEEPRLVSFYRPREWAKEHRIPVISPTFLGIYVPVVSDAILLEGLLTAKYIRGIGRKEVKEEQR